MAGAHDDKVALANLDALGCGAGIEIGRADGIAVWQRVEAPKASDVEQDAAAENSANATSSSSGPSRGASFISPSSDTLIAICRTRGSRASSRIASTPSSRARFL
jgi:hypothetical protein